METARSVIPDIDPNSLLVGMIAGAVGIGYLAYGKKESKLTPAICGVLLMVYPYFIDNIWALLLVGVALAAAPFVIRE